ncbi:MAG: BatA domain-containing protein [Armatimonadota bacterium]
MTFAAPIWLAAAASVVVPILIHLFGRPRPRLRRFPSLMLLRRAQSDRRSTARLRRIVSLILRCLALILLAIVLAGPLSAWPPLARLGERLGATAIVLDTSPSMTATTGEPGRSPARGTPVKPS